MGILPRLVEERATSARTYTGAQIYGRLHALHEAYAAEIRARFPPIPRRVSGYNLTALLPENGFNIARALVGSEGTCVVVLEAKLRLVDWPPARSLLVLGYEDIYTAADHVPEVMKTKPIALEGFDDRLVEDMRAMQIRPENLKLLPRGQGWLIVEYGGATVEDAAQRAEQVARDLRGPHAPEAKVFADPLEQHKIWKIRESGLGATAHVPNKPITWEGWEDSSMPPENLGEYLRQLRALFDKYGYECDLYGHFGQGCVHTRIDFDLETAGGIRKFRAFIHEAAHLAVSLGGSISGEHGDGQSKAELLPIMFGERLMQAFRGFKAIWDPANRMNPGKIVDAYRADENLRLGTAYEPPRVATRFAFTEDKRDFARTMLRCVGVGACRSQQGTMCPSYMATGEEKHSTRGRARLLFEMLNGRTITRGWKEPAVKEALDLCLSCKACKSECPVHVDMATYKAEFLSHYYAGRLRPPAAYAFGMIDRWARLASRFPRAANALIQKPPFDAFAKRVVGIAPARDISPFAEQSFEQWFRGRPLASERRGQTVILWPDTFNNYFHPPVARAAAAVLEHAGFEVRIPPVPLCCGRPLYEFGMVDRARLYLQRILHTLADDIRAGTPIVGLEPACVSVFRVELPQLFPGDLQARRLSSQVQLLSEFLSKHAPELELPPLRRKAVVHGHCHQIRHTTGRRALHLAQVLQMSLEGA